MFGFATSLNVSLTQSLFSFFPGSHTSTSITKSFVDFNGCVPEKFDVVRMTHKVEVEYGNVGVDFKFIPREGFGWMNASYQVGLGYMDRRLRRALGAVMEPSKVFNYRVKVATTKANETTEEQPPDVTTHLFRPHRA